MDQNNDNSSLVYPIPLNPSSSNEVLSQMSAYSHSPDPKSTASPSDAEKPFDASAKADVILRSSDSVDFFVLKAILCVASPVFDNMFSMTRESNEGESMNETKNGMPVVDLAEDSSTLYDLLPLLYPYTKEPTNTLEAYTKVAEAAQKYAMDETLQKLKKLVMSCDTMVEEPVAIFALAMHFGWVEVMREAALNTLAIPLREHLVSGDGQRKYLHFIGAADLCDLLSWRFACQDVLNKIFESWMEEFTTELRYIWPFFSSHLIKRLKETGCPRSAVLMDDRFVSSETMGLLYSALSRYTRKDIEDARGLMMRDIENALTKVPLKINGIVI